MAEKKQVACRVEEGQKLEWESYVEESGRFNSLSGLIRASVESEIAGETSDAEIGSPALSSDVNAMRSDLERVRKDVRWLREQHQDAVDISGVSQELLERLERLPEPNQSVEIPAEVDDETAYRRQQAALNIIHPEDTEQADSEGTNDQTVSALSDDLGVPESQIEDAIDHLQDEFIPVVEVEIDGQTHYFLEE